MITYSYTPSKWKANTLEITGIRTEEKILIIPSQIDGYPVTSIAKSAFRGKQHIKRVTFEDGIEIIDVDAFLDCHFLESVSFPKTLSLIASHAFKRCFRLKEVIVPASLRRIGTGAFEDCHRLKAITIDHQSAATEESELSIGDYAFCNCRELNAFFFSVTPHFIGKDCFAHTALPAVSEDGCIHIAGKILLGYIGQSFIVKIPDGIITIASEAFCGQHFLTQLHIPSSLKNIGEKAFYKCSALKMITGQDRLTAIWSHAFEDCTSLSALPACPELACLGDYAFAGCTGLKQIHIPQNLSTIQAGTFKDCVHTEHIYFPWGLKEIHTCAFENCSGIYHLSLPDSVNFIGKSAFAGCHNLKSFTLPDDLKTLEEDVFGNCSSLMSLTAHHWNFHQGFLGNGIHIDLSFQDENDSPMVTLFYSDDWRRFTQGGRARLMLSLFDAPENIDFSEYDSCLPLLKRTEDQAHFALNRLLYPTGLTENKKAEYETFIKDHARSTLEVILKRDMKHAALLLCECSLLSEEDLELAIELANNYHKTSILLIFMNHKQHTMHSKSSFTTADICDDLFQL